jgi:sulfite exporter TauE/SafE
MSSIKRALQKIKADMRLLKAGPPGKRFIEHHERQRQMGRAGWRTAAHIVAGVVLLLVGLVLSLPPGVPGFLLWIPGLGLLVSRLRPFAIFLDRTEAFFRRLFGQQV